MWWATNSYPAVERANGYTSRAGASKPLHLPEAIEAALLRNAGPHAPLLDLAMTCESSDQDRIETAAERCGIELDAVNAKYFEALAWVRAIKH